MCVAAISVYCLEGGRVSMLNVGGEEGLIQERRYEIRRASTLVGGETKYQIIQNLETDRD